MDVRPGWLPARGVHTHGRSTMKAWNASLLIAGMLVVAASPPAQAQGRSHIGAHVGYNFDVEKALIGAQLLLPIGRRIELYPSFDYYFVNSGSLLGISGDVKFRFPTGGESVFYAGGGVNWLRASAGGNSATDTGWDFLFGPGVALWRDPSVYRRSRHHAQQQYRISARGWVGHHHLLAAVPRGGDLPAPHLRRRAPGRRAASGARCA